MKDLQLTTSPEVNKVFSQYPDSVRNHMFALRELVIETATELNEITELEETLKWGEPSYLTKHGSTVRMDWKSKSPDQYALYFKCTSKLVPTFKTVFKNTFNFEGNRAIIFKMNDQIPIEQLKYCLKAALTYHKVKHLPTLGI